MTLLDEARLSPDGHGGALSETAYFRTALARLELEWLVLRALVGDAAAERGGPTTAAIARHSDARLALAIAELAREIAGPGVCSDQHGPAHNAAAEHALRAMRPVQEYLELLASAESIEAATMAEVSEAILSPRISC